MHWPRPYDSKMVGHLYPSLLIFEMSLLTLTPHNNPISVGFFYRFFNRCLEVIASRGCGGWSFTFYCQSQPNKLV